MLTGEPTTAAGGATEKDMTAFCQLFVPRMVDKSVIATNAEGAVIGAMLCKDWGDEDPEEEFAGFMAKLEGDWLPALTGIGECEETFNSDFGIPVEEKPKEKWFQLWNCGVDEQWRGRGVGKKLVGHSVAVAKKQGYEVAFSICTSGPITHILTTHSSASVEHFVDYSTWTGTESVEVLRALPAAGHSGMSLCVVRLWGESKRSTRGGSAEDE
ncbi:hypothetical protein TrLO_g7002 [Triparma laevis f. longispina]|uniref:N-acetyltransferase domain-containing protein n=1 Tax=Triparma laevis f. longispina TaxID=1714387 RepID=A0A9W7EC88_9STRA|nr:hypothetical protein TrLO_g7002 [Triparma laevis f. longispina]